MKIIEFTGIPGSGKTTLLPAVKKGLRQAGVDVLDAGDIITRHISAGSCIKHVFPFLPKRIRQFFSFRLFRLHNIAQFSQLEYAKCQADVYNIMIEINQTRDISAADKDLVLKSFLATACVWQIATSNKNNMESSLILDEGFLQKVVNLFVSVNENVPNPDMLKRYLHAVPLPDLVFDVSTDNIQKNMDRMIKRRLPKRLSGASTDEIMHFLQKARETLNITIDLMIAAGTKVVRLPNNSQARSLITATRIAEKEASGLLQR